MKKRKRIKGIDYKIARHGLVKWEVDRDDIFNHYDVLKLTCKYEGRDTNENILKKINTILLKSFKVKTVLDAELSNSVLYKLLDEFTLPDIAAINIKKYYTEYNDIIIYTNTWNIFLKEKLIKELMEKC